MIQKRKNRECLELKEPTRHPAIIETKGAKNEVVLILAHLSHIF